MRQGTRSLFMARDYTLHTAANATHRIDYRAELNDQQFAAEELDFILNDVIKYRLGRGAGEGEET